MEPQEVLKQLIQKNSQPSITMTPSGGIAHVTGKTTLWADPSVITGVWVDEVNDSKVSIENLDVNLQAVEAAQHISAEEEERMISSPEYLKHLKHKLATMLAEAMMKNDSVYFTKQKTAAGGTIVRARMCVSDSVTTKRIAIARSTHK